MTLSSSAFLEGFGQVIVRAQADGLYYFAGIADAGKHHHFQPRHQLAQLLQGLQAIDPRHQEVEQHQVGTQTLLHLLQGIFARGSGLHRVVIHLEQGADVAQHSGFVIDQ